MPIDVAHFTRQQSRPTGCTKGIGTKHVLKNSTFLPNPVNIGRFDIRAAVGADGFKRMIVRKNDQNIGLGIRRKAPFRANPCSISEQKKQGKSG